MIVRLVYVRNLITKHEHEIDFNLDLHPSEAEVTALFENAQQITEDISHDNARD
jgi:hypothetical protein